MKFLATLAFLLPFLASVAEARHQFWLEGDMHIYDAEGLFRLKHTRRSLSVSRWFGKRLASIFRPDRRYPDAVTLPQWTEKFDGEIRVEVDCDLHHDPDDESVEVNCAARFYEGTTTSTNKLRQSKDFEFSVAKGETERYDIKLTNPGFRDYTTIAFTARNW